MIAHVLVLLPPSEAKTVPRTGRPLDLATLSFPTLTATRARLLDAVVELATTAPELARAVLGLSAAQGHEVDRNRTLRTAAAAPAHTVYSGVLYDALGLAKLPPAARRRARASVVVFSALFGALRIGDRIPAYRLSAGVTLPAVGPVNAIWRTPLAEAMEAVAGHGLLVDMRSSAYAAMWQPSVDVRSRVVAVRVLQARPDGSRTVVSHFNKATKGHLLGSLLGLPAPRDPESLAAGCESLGYRVELDRARAGRAHRLDVVVSDV